MAATLGVVAFVLLGTAGLVVVLTCTITVALVRPRVSVGFVMWLYDAQPLPRWAAPRLHRIVDVLSERARLTGPPRLYYVRTSVPNAFVAGSGDEAALAVTDGLLRLLDGREVAGVVGHELGHLVDGDMSVMALSDVVARLAQWMVWIGLWSSFLSVPLLLATGDARPVLVSTALVALPVVVTLAQLALSRSREYDADAAAVALTGDPEGLARALVMLDDSAGRIWERILVGRSGRPDPMLLRTHPSTEQRLRRLRDMRVEQERHHVESRPLAPVGYPAVTHGPRLRRTGVRWFTPAGPARGTRTRRRGRCSRPPRP
jgi:heat shock protein HtpX